MQTWLYTFKRTIKLKSLKETNKNYACKYHFLLYLTRLKCIKFVVQNKASLSELEIKCFHFKIMY